MACSIPPIARSSKIFQVVFLDTPGVVSKEEAKKFNLEESLLNDPVAACKGSDLILVLQVGKWPSLSLLASLSLKVMTGFFDTYLDSTMGKSSFHFDLCGKSLLSLQQLLHRVPD